MMRVVLWRLSPRKERYELVSVLLVTVWTLLKTVSCVVERLGFVAVVVYEDAHASCDPWAVVAIHVREVVRVEKSAFPVV